MRDARMRHSCSLWVKVDKQALWCRSNIRVGPSSRRPSVASLLRNELLACLSRSSDHAGTFCLLCGTGDSFEQSHELCDKIRILFVFVEITVQANRTDHHSTLFACQGGEVWQYLLFEFLQNFQAMVVSRHVIVETQSSFDEAIECKQIG